MKNPKLALAVLILFPAPLAWTASASWAEKITVEAEGTGASLFLTPFIQAGGEDMEPLISHNDFYQCPVFIYEIFLDIAISDIVNMKDLTTEYSLESYTGTG